MADQNFSDTWRGRATRTMGSNVLSGVLVASLIGACSSLLTMWAQQYSVGTEMAAIRTQLTELRQEVHEIRRDLYRPVASGREK